MDTSNGRYLRLGFNHQFEILVVVGLRKWLLFSAWLMWWTWVIELSWKGWGFKIDVSLVFLCCSVSWPTRASSWSTWQTTITTRTRRRSTRRLRGACSWRWTGGGSRGGRAGGRRSPWAAWPSTCRCWPNRWTPTASRSWGAACATTTTTRCAPRRPWRPRRRPAGRATSAAAAAAGRRTAATAARPPRRADIVTLPRMRTFVISACKWLLWKSASRGMRIAATGGGSSTATAGPGRPRRRRRNPAPRRWPPPRRRPQRCTRPPPLEITKEIIRCNCRCCLLKRTRMKMTWRRISRMRTGTRWRRPRRRRRCRPRRRTPSWRSPPPPRRRRCAGIGAPRPETARPPGSAALTRGYDTHCDTYALTHHTKNVSFSQQSFQDNKWQLQEQHVWLQQHENFLSR